MTLAELLDALAAKLRGRRVVPPEPDHVWLDVPDEEPIEDHVEERIEPQVIPMALVIEYVDSKGQASTRRIACRQVEPATNTLLAFCFERKATRRFRVDRIRAAWSVADGEVYDPAALIKGLGRGEVGCRDERLSRILTILVFLMRCDGFEHPRERAVIEEAAQSFALRFDGDGEMVHFALRHAFDLAPDTDDLTAALSWIAARTDRRSVAMLLQPYIDRVITADGRITSEEAHFAGLINDTLKALAAA